jgi:hypothetical protein
MTFLAEPPKKRDERVEEKEEEECEIIFDQTPVKVVCPHCGLSVITFIEHESSWVTYTAAVAMLMTLGWAALCVVPITFPLFKDVVHHCPRCLNVLATRSRVAVAGFKSEVMSIRVGSCVVVLARKWVMLLVGLSILIGGIHMLRSRSTVVANPVDTPARGVPTGLSWQDFNKDCGFKSYLGNPIHVTVAFNDKYKAKTFRWQGKLHHVEEGFTLLWWSQRGAVFARMDPPQFTNRREMPDLVLLYDDTDEKLAKEVSKLKKGEEIGFEASMVEVGRRGIPHTMVLWELFKPTPNHTQASAEKKVDV